MIRRRASGLSKITVLTPDILIDNDPVKEWNGEDQQLNKAIEEVMKDLQNRKPLVPVPAPRISASNVEVKYGRKDISHSMGYPFFHLHA